MGTWDMIRSERASLVDALAALPAADWGRPSLATGWTVRDVVAHMIATAQMTPPKFFGGLASTGFKFNAMSEKNIAKVREARTDVDLVATYRSLIDARSAPPGPATSWLGETIVHGEDVFRALGGYREHPAENLTAVGDFYSGSNLLIGAKRRIEGVTLRADDSGWSHGSGPELTGPHIALVMAMCGRKVALDDLSGPGVEVLRARP
jgi:uncharacterized protein (TIGR03083 family)